MVIPRSGPLRDENGSEGSEGDHHYGDAGFDLCPDVEPCLVEGTTDLKARDAGTGGDGHEDVQAEEYAEAELLPSFDVDSPEEADGEGDDLL